jgi:hypothetical protein
VKTGSRQVFMTVRTFEQLSHIYKITTYFCRKYETIVIFDTTSFINFKENFKMATTEKAMQIARDLKDLFSKEIISTMPYVTDGFTSEGNPYISMSVDSTPTLNHKVVVVVVKPYSTGTAKDSLGNTANSYTPHVIQFCTEANYAGTTDNTADILTPVELLPIICEIAKRGSYVEWHQTANGTVPSAAAIVAGTVLKATFKAHLYFGIQAAV